MSQYYKTDLGIESLKQRSMNLNARQRRLLLLIGTEDFDQLNEQFKQRIATPELLEQLSHLGLIAQDTLVQSHVEIPVNHLDSEIEVHPQIQPSTVTPEKQIPAVILSTFDNLATEISHAVPMLETENKIEVTLQVLDFEEVKNLMIQLLQQNCGLMAKQLINRIVQAEDLTHLKSCQMQWITTLQESRISANELNFHLKQINFSLQKMVTS
jgi:hypothetical protein